MTSEGSTNVVVGNVPTLTIVASFAMHACQSFSHGHSSKRALASVIGAPSRVSVIMCGSTTAQFLYVKDPETWKLGALFNDPTQGRL